MANLSPLITEAIPVSGVTVDEIQERLISLRNQLDDFYTTTTQYIAFNTTTDHSGLHEVIRPIVEKIIAEKGSARVLELGAGRTGYLKSLGSLRDKVTFDVQDITPANREYLQENADHVFICDIGKIDGQYDLIFSFYVFEHVTNPTAFLKEVDRLIAPHGWHFLVCPRYDAPGYLCPSLRHLRGIRRLKLQLQLPLSRLAARIDKRPRFWINSDPALFHGPWYRDADAVHIVSSYDLAQWHASHGYRIENVRLQSASWKDWVRHNLLTTLLMAHK